MRTLNWPSIFWKRHCKNTLRQEIPVCLPAESKFNNSPCRSFGRCDRTVRVETMGIAMHSPLRGGWGDGSSSLFAIIRKQGSCWPVPDNEQGSRRTENPVDMFLRNYVDLFPRTSGAADIQTDVSTQLVHKNISTLTESLIEKANPFESSHNRTAPWLSIRFPMQT